MPLADDLPSSNFHFSGVCGQSIGTTAEHPFFVKEKGWTPAALLTPGDLLRTHDNRWLPLESIEDTGEVATVYNFRIAEYHTYFVGKPDWGFSVWAHNANYAVQEAVENGVINPTSKIRAAIGGIAATAKHHIFPKQFKKWFLERGIKVDEYLVTIERTLHEAIHAGKNAFGKGGWYTYEIMNTLRKAEAALERTLRPEEIKDIVSKLLPKFGINLP